MAREQNVSTSHTQWSNLGAFWIPNLWSQSLSPQKRTTWVLGPEWLDETCLFLGPLTACIPFTQIEDWSIKKWFRSTLQQKSQLASKHKHLKIQAKFKKQHIVEDSVSIPKQNHVWSKISIVPPPRYIFMENMTGSKGCKHSQPLLESPSANSTVDTRHPTRQFIYVYLIICCCSTSCDVLAQFEDQQPEQKKHEQTEVDINNIQAASTKRMQKLNDSTSINMVSAQTSNPVSYVLVYL